MDLSAVFSNIKETFTLRKKVSFGDLNLKFELEPLNSLEEIKVLEFCNDVDGAQYIDAIKKQTLSFAIKKINDIELPSIIESDGEDGPIKEVRNKYMLKQVEQWPAALKDSLFDAFTDLQAEVENKVSESVKFDKFLVSPETKEKTDESKLKPVEVSDEDEGLTDVEKESKVAQKEVEKIQDEMAKTGTP